MKTVTKLLLLLNKKVETFPPLGYVDIFPEGGAASYGSNEKNTITPFNDQFVTTTSEDLANGVIEPVNGNKCIKILAVSGGTAGRSEFNFPVISGHSYRHRFKVARGVGSHQRLWSWTGYTVSPNITAGSMGLPNATIWTQLDFTIIANITGNALNRYYASSSSSGALNSVLNIDDYTIEDLGII